MGKAANLTQPRGTSPDGGTPSDGASTARRRSLGEFGAGAREPPPNRFRHEPARSRHSSTAGRLRRPAHRSAIRGLSSLTPSTGGRATAPRAAPNALPGAPRPPPVTTGRRGRRAPPPPRFPATGHRPRTDRNLTSRQVAPAGRAATVAGSRHPPTARRWQTLANWYRPIVAFGRFAVCRVHIAPPRGRSPRPAGRRARSSPTIDPTFPRSLNDRVKLPARPDRG